MKKVVSITGVASLAAMLIFSNGCEWSGGGGSGSYNTSQGAGINVNFSGVYHGNYSSGKAVASSSGAPITRLTLTQAGNSLEVIDNNGNKYKGNAGSPGLVFTPTVDNPVIPPGAELMQAQVNFEGTDGSSGRQVQFVGVVHVVTVSDIKSSTSSSGSSSSSSGNSTTTQTINDGTNTTVTTTIVTPVSTIVTVETRNNQTGATISKTTTESENESQSQSQTYSITEATAQYRLEGQWVEKGGNTSGVDALSPAGSGVVSTPIN